MTIVLTTTVMRGAATATPLGACLPVIAITVIAPVIPLSCLCVSCGNDAQLGDGVRGPLLGCPFNCHGVCRGWSCSSSTRSGSDDRLGDRVSSLLSGVGSSGVR